MQKLQHAKLEDFDAISNIGPVVAASVHEWFAQKNNIKLLEKLHHAGIKIVSQKLDARSQKLAGNVFIFTGSLDTIERELAKEKVRDLGGQTTESISAKVDFVVAGSEAGSKLTKAERLGLKIIGEKEFLEMIS